MVGSDLGEKRLPSQNVCIKLWSSSNAKSRCFSRLNKRMAPMRYPEGHKEETRARIIEEAARAFREEGLEGLSVAALM